MEGRERERRGGAREQESESERRMLSRDVCRLHGRTMAQRAARGGLANAAAGRRRRVERRHSHRELRLVCCAVAGKDVYSV